eukprot:gene30977-40305_t
MLQSKSNLQSCEESIAVVILVNKRTDIGGEQIVSFIQSIENAAISSAWLSKGLLLKVISSDVENKNESTTRYSTSLEEWLRVTAFFDPNNPFSSMRSRNYGLIREAYVVDLTSLTDKGISNPRWDHIQLAFTGVNGNLPNLDMISYPLEMFPRELHPESNGAVCSQIFQYLKSLSRQEGNPILQYPLQFISNLLLDVDNAVDYIYKEQFCGMMTHLWLLGQGPTGLHGQFLLRNIDSISLKPVRIRNFSQGGGGITLEKLSEVVMSFVYVSSNLHEELHHSYFFYVMLGSGHFMGITEYGIVAGVMLLALFFLLLKVEMGRSPDLAIISLRPAERLRCYFQVAVCMAVEVLLSSSVPLLWGGWRESLLAHGVAGALACSQAYYYRARNLCGGETARMRVTVLIVFLLLSLSALLSAHYALGAACWAAAIIPVLSLCAAIPVVVAAVAGGSTINTTTYILVVFSLVTIGLMCSPPMGIALLSKWGLLSPLLDDWKKFGSVTLPAMIGLQSAISCCALHCIAQLLCGASKRAAGDASLPFIFSSWLPQLNSIEFKTESRVHLVYGDLDNTQDHIDTAGVSCEELERILKEKIAYGLTLRRAPIVDDSERDTPIDIVEAQRYTKWFDDGF